MTADCDPSQDAASPNSVDLETSTGRYTMRPVDEDGVIRVSICGFFTPEIINEGMLRLGRLLLEQRKSGKLVKLLVDSRDVNIYSAESGLHLKDNMEAIHSEGDYVAVVTSSRLAAMQYRRIANHPLQIFDNEQEALTWLKSIG